MALEPAEMATVSGVVRDGAGQGWPLYAKLTISGYPGGPVFTDPGTGRYSVILAQDTTYDVVVTPQYDGYRSRSVVLEVEDGDVTQDLGLAVEPGCTAPGYRWDGVEQRFDSWTARSHRGWTRSGGWRLDNPGQRSTPVGAAGRFAIADSGRSGAPLGPGGAHLAPPRPQAHRQATPHLRHRLLRRREAATRPGAAQHRQRPHLAHAVAAGPTHHRRGGLDPAARSGRPPGRAGPLPLPRPRRALVGDRQRLRRQPHLRPGAGRPGRRRDPGRRHR
ncbi:carboxypeptidase-like regulatory domain-containing protein [Nocardioides sp. TF02-7]|nr:carboxypeptidase-like regulatory domain-containing protein [Nocardioides sp. TF02-7]